jgi:hypothetical protein
MPMLVPVGPALRAAAVPLRALTLDASAALVVLADLAPTTLVLVGAYAFGLVSTAVALLRAALE